MFNYVLCPLQPVRTSFTPKWSPSRELNSMFVKLMQKLPVGYYLSCILWPLSPVPKCSPQGVDSLLAQLLLRLLQCVINFLHSAVSWIFTLSLRSFSGLLKHTQSWKRYDTLQLLSCHLHHSFQPVQSTGQDFVPQDYSVPPNWWAILATIIPCNKTQAITSFVNTLVSIR